MRTMLETCWQTSTPLLPLVRNIAESENPPIYPISENFFRIEVCKVPNAIRECLVANRPVNEIQLSPTAVCYNRLSGHSIDASPIS